MLHTVKRGPTAQTADQYIDWFADELKRWRKSWPIEARREQARMVFEEFLEDEGIEFGDPEWLWDEAAARDDAWNLWYEGLRE